MTVFDIQLKIAHLLVYTQDKMELIGKDTVSNVGVMAGGWWESQEILWMNREMKLTLSMKLSVQVPTPKMWAAPT